MRVPNFRKGEQSDFVYIIKLKSCLVYRKFYASTISLTIRTKENNDKSFLFHSSRENMDVCALSLSTTSYILYYNLKSISPFTFLNIWATKLPEKKVWITLRKCVVFLSEFSSFVFFFFSFFFGYERKETHF